MLKQPILILKWVVELLMNSLDDLYVVWERDLRIIDLDNTWFLMSQMTKYMGRKILPEWNCKTTSLPRTQHYPQPLPALNTSKVPESALLFSKGIQPSLSGIVLGSRCVLSYLSLTTDLRRWVSWFLFHRRRNWSLKMLKNLFKVTLSDSDRTIIQAKPILNAIPGFPDAHAQSDPERDNLWAAHPRTCRHPRSLNVKDHLHHVPPTCRVWLLRDSALDLPKALERWQPPLLIDCLVAEVTQVCYCWGCWVSTEGKACYQVRQVASRTSALRSFWDFLGSLQASIHLLFL